MEQKNTKTDTRGPNPLEWVAVAGMIALIIITSVTGPLGGALRAQFMELVGAVLPGVIVELTNEERMTRDLGDLTRSLVLDEAATMKAEHMLKGQYFAHYSPGENISPWYWFEQVGYDYVHAGENLAVYYDDSEEIVQAWMESPLHRDNILKAHYTEIGMGVAEGRYDGFDTVFVVQLFGTPLVQTARAAPVEPAAEPPLSTTPPPVTRVVQEPVVELVPDGPVITVATEATVPTDIVRVDIEDSIAYVSDHIATTTLAVGAVQAAQTDTPTRNTAPLYISLALLLGAVLCTSLVRTLIAREYRHTVYSTALLLLMLAVVKLHVETTQYTQAALF